MQAEQKKEEKSSAKGHAHGKHMWMMALCCGLPIVGLLAIGWLGVAAPSLETLILLICPIGMVGMMVMMHRDNKGKSCCTSEKTKNRTAPHKGAIEADEQKEIAQR